MLDLVSEPVSLWKCSRGEWSVSRSGSCQQVREHGYADGMKRTVFVVKGI